MTLIDQPYVVKKLGGENAAEMLKSSRNIIEDAKKGIQQAVVISAMRSKDFNTTDVLIEIGNAVSNRNSSDVERKIQEIETFHKELLKEKLESLPSVYEKALGVLEEEIIQVRDILIYALKTEQRPEKKSDYTIKTAKGRSLSIIGFGEVLSAKIFSTVVNELSQVESSEAKSTVIDTSNAVGEILGDNPFMTLAQSLQQKIGEQEAISVVPGYVGGFEQGIEEAIGRGYSDATAAALAVGLKERGVGDVMLEIQKSVRGMLSADPRILTHSNEARLLGNVSYITAKEIVGGAKAKLLHNQALRREIIDNGIRIKLFDPFGNPNEGTIIGGKVESKKEKGIQFIGGKEAVFFSISSTNFGGLGVLATAFSVVKDYASIDIHSGSETEISFSIEAGSAKNLRKLQKKLQHAFDIKENTKTNFVKYATEKATVHCVGNLKGTIGLSRKVTQVLEDNGINIEIQSQGAQERAIVVGINKSDLPKAVNALHNYFMRK